MRAPLGAFLCLVIALAGGCDRECIRNSDCPPGYICEPSGRCDVPPAPMPGADAGDEEDEAAVGDEAESVADLDASAGAVL